jgi:hypothetical protein
MLALGPAQRSTACHRCRHGCRRPHQVTTPSLIPSLIHLRPEPFGAHQAERATQIADPADLG